MSEKNIGIMDYCHDLENKVREARKERDKWKGHCLLIVTFGKWPWAFWCGMVGGAILTVLVILGVKLV